MDSTKPRDYQFRVFLSYARADKSVAEGVVSVLEGRGLKVLWDRDIHAGHPFSEAIRSFIANSHIFMPLITSQSHDRPWLHREEGYALALNIPIVPLMIGSNHNGTQYAESGSILLTENLQAIQVADDCSDLAERLGDADFESVVFSAEPRTRAMLVEIAQWQETRAELMGKNAARVLAMGDYGTVRQRGALSSFCVPDRDIRHAVWDRREGERKRSDYLRSLQKRERQALERNAQRGGIKLIIDPWITIARATLDPVKARLESLLDFLGSVREEQAQVISHKSENHGNVTIVGDWFVAEAQIPRPGDGYRQTVFTWHAPTVLTAVREFDSAFATICREQDVDPNKSLSHTVEILNRRLKEL